jgi:hypothetical protein
MQGLMIGVLVALLLALIILVAVAVSRRDGGHGIRTRVVGPYDYHDGHHHPHHRHHLIGGCSTTEFGCCSDGVTAKANRRGSNCPLY